MAIKSAENKYASENNNIEKERPRLTKETLCDDAPPKEKAPCEKQLKEGEDKDENPQFHGPVVGGVFKYEQALNKKA